MAHFSRRVLLQWRGTVLLFLLAFCYTPATANATCGDYVTIRTTAGKNTTGTDSLDLHSSSTARNNPAHSDPGSPCRGPNCSGSPVQNPIPPFSWPTAQPQPKECLKSWLRQFDNGDPFYSSIPIPSTEALPTGSIASIYHPPREV
ncbi:MAG TPA: hypothetical protein VG097_07720 [Gemmata sp.]|nr:hypothetical protein [Gemmata sp.]